MRRTERSSLRVSVPASEGGGGSPRRGVPQTGRGWKSPPRSRFAAEWIPGATPRGCALATAIAVQQRVHAGIGVGHPVLPVDPVHRIAHRPELAAPRLLQQHVSAARWSVVTAGPAPHSPVSATGRHSARLRGTRRPSAGRCGSRHRPPGRPPRSTTPIEAGRAPAGAHADGRSVPACISHGARPPIHASRSPMVCHASHITPCGLHDTAAAKNPNRHFGPSTVETRAHHQA